MNLKAGDSIYRRAQGSAQKLRGETDYLIMFLTSPEKGFMLIVYGSEPNGSLYRADRFVEGDEFFPLNSTTQDEQRYLMRRVLSDKMTRWE